MDVCGVVRSPLLLDVGLVRWFSDTEEAGLVLVFENRWGGG